MFDRPQAATSQLGEQLGEQEWGPALVLSPEPLTPGPETMLLWTLRATATHSQGKRGLLHQQRLGALSAHGMLNGNLVAKSLHMCK